MGIAITNLGKMLRKLRIDAGERIADLATEVGCTTSFLSAVELGRKSPPNDLLTKIASHYRLSAEQETDLRNSALASTTAVRIDLNRGNNDLSKELAVAFARAFPTIDRQKAADILKALGDHNDPGDNSK